jgi:hypothetical protein
MQSKFYIVPSLAAVLISQQILGEFSTTLGPQTHVESAPVPSGQPTTFAPVGFTGGYAQIGQGNPAMITTQAACCLISSKPGVSHGTTFAGRLAQPIKCAHCDAEYRIEYVPSDRRRIENYDDRLRATAQEKVNHDHPWPENSIIGHTLIISIYGISD